MQEALLPAGQRIKALLVCDIKNEGTAIGSTVESISEGLEFLLPCSVPYLKINLLVIDHDLLLLEIGTNSRLRHACLLVYILLQESCLANTRVSENDYLQKLLLLAAHCFDYKIYIEFII